MLPHNTQSSLFTTHVEKVHALEGVITEHDVIKHEVGPLRQLVKKSAAWEGEEGDGKGSGAVEDDDDDDDARNICMIILHELEISRTMGRW